MIWLRFIGLAFALMSAVMPAAWAARTRVQTQLETGFFLRETAASRLLAAHDFTLEERTDYYLEIFDGSEFLLDGSPDGHKLRLKATADKSVLQAGYKVRLEAHQCRSGLQFKLREKRVGERRLKDREHETFVDLFTAQQRLLEQGEGSAAARKIVRLDGFIKDLDLPLLPDFLALPGHERWHFTAAFQSRKIKWKSEVKVAGASLVLSITEARDHYGSEHLQTRHEMEVQAVDEDLNVSQFAAAICALAARDGLTAEDLAAERVDARATALGRLRLIRGDLAL